MRNFLKVIGWIIFFVGTCAVAWWLADRLFGGHGGIAAIIWGGLILLILVVIPQIKEWKSDSEELERQRRDSLKKAQEGEVPLEDDEVDDLDEDLDPDDLFADEDLDFWKDIDLSCDDDEEPEEENLLDSDISAEDEIQTDLFSDEENSKKLCDIMVALDDNVESDKAPVEHKEDNMDEDIAKMRRKWVRHCPKKRADASESNDLYIELPE